MKKLFKFILTILICFFVFYSVDFSALLSLKNRISYPSLSLFFFISLPMIWASSMKWKLFIPPSPNKPSILTLMKFYTISYFANLFLPSSIGGDATRSLKLGTKIANQKKAFIATFFERFTGLITLVIVALIGNFFGEYSSTLLRQLNIFFLVLVLLLFYLMTSIRGLSILRFAANFIPQQTLKEKGLEFLQGNAPVHFLKPGFLLKALLWSLLFYALTVINTYLGLKSISCENVSFIDLMLVVPLVLFVSMLPITPGAIGVMEGAFVFFLTKIGISAPESLALALLLRAKALLLALIGWFLYLSEGRSRQL